MTESNKRSQSDWERIEVQYRAGVMSLREIAGKHGITEGAIRKKAKAEGWDRDLEAKVKAKAEALVRKELVRESVRAESLPRTEAEEVSISAEVLARVQISHRKDIGASRSLVMGLLGELRHQSENQELYEQLAELVVPAEEDEGSEASQRRADKLREAFHRAMGLSSRSSTMKSLADSLKVLVAMEREAFGIGQEKGGPDGYEDFLKSLAG